LLPFYRN